MQDSDTEHLAFSILSNKYGASLYNARLRPWDIYQLFSQHSFWRDALICWLNYHFAKEISVNDQPLWLNMNIRINNIPVYFNNWARNGIKTINDLKDNDLIGFRTWENLCGTYGVKIPITEYYGLLQAIPAQWKQNLSETICSDQTKEPRYETVNYI